MYEIWIKTKGIMFQHPETGATIRTPRKFLIKKSSLARMELLFRAMVITDYEVTDLGDEYVETRDIIPASKVKRSENINMNFNGKITGRMGS